MTDYFEEQGNDYLMIAFVGGESLPDVILRPDAQVVLVDFGLVKLWDPADPRTQTAMRGMGTPEYAPPEQ